jgi:hypothetical protein
MAKMMGQVAVGGVLPLISLMLLSVLADGFRHHDGCDSRTEAVTRI